MIINNTYFNKIKIFGGKDSVFLRNSYKTSSGISIFKHVF